MAEKFWLNNPDGVQVCCMECGWSGFAVELKAQACPVCDGRCREIQLASEDESEAGDGYGHGV